MPALTDSPQTSVLGNAATARDTHSGLSATPPLTAKDAPSPVEATKAPAALADPCLCCNKNTCATRENSAVTNTDRRGSLSTVDGIHQLIGDLEAQKTCDDEALHAHVRNVSRGEMAITRHPSAIVGAVGPFRRFFHSWKGHGALFSFYSQFFLIFCFYVCEYLEILNVLNRPRGFIAGLPGFVMLVTIINTLVFQSMRRLQLLTCFVEFLCFIGLLVYDAITPRNMDDRHRTEYYDMHAHAAALNFILLVIYGMLGTERYTRWIAEEEKTMNLLTNEKLKPQPEVVVHQPHSHSHV